MGLSPVPMGLSCLYGAELSLWGCAVFMGMFLMGPKCPYGVSFLLMGLSCSHGAQ